VGTWDIRGRTLEAATVNIRGRVWIEWLPRGLLMQQRSALRVGNLRVRSVDIVGYDPVSKTFPSFVYPNFEVDPLPYRWEVRGDSIVHSGIQDWELGLLVLSAKTADRSLSVGGPSGADCDCDRGQRLRRDPDPGRVGPNLRAVRPLT
jgi:hypothetical protein